MQCSSPHLLCLGWSVQFLQPQMRHPPPAPTNNGQNTPSLGPAKMFSRKEAMIQHWPVFLQSWHKWPKHQKVIFLSNHLDATSKRWLLTMLLSTILTALPGHFDKGRRRGSFSLPNWDDLECRRDGDHCRGRLSQPWSHIFFSHNILQALKQLWPSGHNTTQKKSYGRADAMQRPLMFGPWKKLHLWNEAIYVAGGGCKISRIVDGSGQNHEEKIEAHFSPGDLEGKSLRNPKHWQSQLRKFKQ